MNKIGIAILSFGLITLASACKTSTKLTADNNKLTVGSVACVSNAAAGVPNISWVVEADESLYDKDNPVMLPQDHSLYSVDPSQASAYFAHAKAGETEIALPLPVGCKTFKMKISSTMSPELSKKYPNLVALSGNEAGTGKGDARLEYNGSRISGQIIWGKSVYMIMPVQKQGKYYYIVYEKQDSPEPKKMNETKAEVIRYDK